MSECWDSDPDLDLPPGTFSLALHLSTLGTTSDAETETESSSAGASALFSGNGEGVEWGDEDDEGYIGAPASEEGETGDLGRRDTTPRASDVTTMRELAPGEEEDQGSSMDSRNGTIKSLLSSFNGLSLASPTKHSASSTDDSSSTTSVDTQSATPQQSLGLSSADKTLRLSSSLSALLATAVSGPGRIIHLGSTPQGQAKSVLGDWDEDLDLDLPTDLRRPLRGKSSFASHISDDPEDDFLDMSLPTPRTNRRPSVALSHASVSEVGDSDFDESDFELPTSLAQVNLSPLLARTSMTSLSGVHSRASSSSLPSPTPIPSTSTLKLPSSQLANPSSPFRSHGDTSAEEDEDDDEGFFEEIVLPSYFLGGPGAMTPPSDGEGINFGRKLDLQAILKAKLEARGREGEGREAAGKGKGKANRLDGFREGNEDEGVEHGLEIGDVKLGPERMRTRSGPQPPSLKMRNRTHSSAPGRRPPIPTRASTTSAIRLGSSNSPPKPVSSNRAPSIPRTTSNSSLSRSGTNAAPTAFGVGLGRPPRPSSASGAVERVGTRERRAAGPPPAPSTALRDRVRTRTTSLRPSQSTSNIVDLATPTQKRVPPRIDTTSASAFPSPALSPPPMTPATPSHQATNRTLRNKRSQGNLLATPTMSSRTLERKRSLQNISSLALESPTVPYRRPLRSPTPGASLPGSPILSADVSQTPRQSATPRLQSSFALPTAASASRIRERVISGPSAVPASAVLSSQRHFQHPPRPASAAGWRLTQPTLASKAKTRSLSGGSGASTAPSPPHTLARPKRARQYGDGTELDGFDDLPTSKERERERMVSAKGTVRSKPAPGTRTTPSSPQKPPAATTVTAGRRLVKRDLSSVSLSSLDDATAAKSKAKPAGSRPLASRTDSMSTVKASKSPSKKSKADPLATERTRFPTVGPVPTSKKRKEPRKEPQLIRNLGHPVVKTQGEMVWNPLQQRWEGNESVLQDFDRVMSTSTRPALITHLSQGSPARIGFPSLSSITPLRPNVKVVGSMVFDPVRMSWFSISSEEDELDLNFGMEGELADDEGDEDGWEKGEHARMLKNRASFVMSEGSRDGDSDAGDEGGERKAIWAECLEGERRHREEMKAWTVQVSARSPELEDTEREWLWDIRRSPSHAPQRGSRTRAHQNSEYRPKSQWVLRTDVRDNLTPLMNYTQQLTILHSKAETLECCASSPPFDMPAAEANFPRLTTLTVGSGLAAHAVTLMLLATQFMGWRGVTAPQAYVGNLYFFAGLYMFTSAQWCLVKGETFAYLVFAGFYLSYGAILTPAFGVAAAYSGAPGTATSTATEYQSLATFLYVWSGAFTIIFLASLRTNICLVIVFLGVILGVYLLGAMYIQLAEVAIDAGKGSMATAHKLSQLFESVDMPFQLPVGNLAPVWPKKKTN
ncbi:uncharacterized protein P7C70_g2634, partial [Phenoliferia sp. Uapishka_3]